MKYLLAIFIIYLASFNTIDARPLINQLKTGDTLTITMFSNGCRNIGFDYLLIVKTESNYKAIYMESEAILSSKDLKAIRKFERNKIANTCSICTTTNTYTISLGEKTHQKKDYCCGNWKGYKKLLNQLGFNKS